MSENRCFRSEPVAPSFKANSFGAKLAWLLVGPQLENVYKEAHEKFGDRLVTDAEIKTIVSHPHLYPHLADGEEHYALRAYTPWGGYAFVPYVKGEPGKRLIRGERRLDTDIYGPVQVLVRD